MRGSRARPSFLSWEEIADDSDEDEITFRRKITEVHAKRLLRDLGRVHDTIEKHLKDREREYQVLPMRDIPIENLKQLERFEKLFGLDSDDAPDRD